MRFAELAPAGVIVAGQSSQLGALDMRRSSSFRR